MPLPQIVLGLYFGKIKVRPADRNLMQVLRSVEVNQSDDGAGGAQQGFQITFSAQRPLGRSAEYELLKDPRLAPGNRVVITITLAARPRVLVDGIITHQQLPFGAGNGDATFVLMGRDISVLMDLEEKNKVYKKMKHKEVVEQILQEYVKLGIQTEVKNPPAKWPLEPPQQMPTQHRETDRNYLRRLAAANGFLFHVRPGPTPGKNVAYWGPPPRRSDEQPPALTTNMGTATNVDTINFSFDAMAATAVETAVSDANTEKAIDAEAGQTTRKPALAKRPTLTAGRTLLRTTWLDYAGPDPNEAKARAQALADQSTDRAVSGSGTLDTLRYGDILTAPGMVAVRGAGASYDGDYYVKTVKHRISIPEYKQEFTLSREGLGTKIQQVARTR